MAIRAPNKPDTATPRRKVKVSGKDSLVDVAKRVFKDERVVPLLKDLNPKASPRGALPAGTVVVLPAREEAQKFAARMGFQLGFDPAKGGSTRAKRNWKKMQQGGQRPVVANDPAQLASALAGQGLPPDAAAERLSKLLDDAELRAFAVAEHEEEAVAAIAAAAELVTLRRDARQALVGLADVLSGTRKPRGRLALLDACARDAGVMDATLEALLVVPPLRKDLLAAAPAVSELIARAGEVARLDEHQADGALADEGGRRAQLEPVVEALRQGLPALGDERLALVGVQPQLAALEKHFSQLAQVLARVTDSVERAPAAALRAFLAGDREAKLPKPWPVVVGLQAAIGAPLAALHAGRRALGVGALGAAAAADLPPAADVPRPAAPSLSAAELAAAAAANAAHADAHDEVPERLAPVMIALFDALRPSAPATGPDAQRKQRRKARFDKAALAPRAEEGDADVIESLVEELLELARDVEDASVARRAARLKAPVRAGALALARGATGPVPALLRGASNVARALIVTALALDPELGATLGKGAGQEAALALFRRHATRALTLAAKAYPDAD